MSAKIQKKEIDTKQFLGKVGKEEKRKVDMKVFSGME